MKRYGLGTWLLALGGAAIAGGTPGDTVRVRSPYDALIQQIQQSDDTIPFTFREGETVIEGKAYQCTGISRDLGPVTLTLYPLEGRKYFITAETDKSGFADLKDVIAPSDNLPSSLKRLLVYDFSDNGIGIPDSVNIKTTTFLPTGGGGQRISSDTARLEAYSTDPKVKSDIDLEYQEALKTGCNRDE